MFEPGEKLSWKELTCHCRVLLLAKTLQNTQEMMVNPDLDGYTKT